VSEIVLRYYAQHCTGVTTTRLTTVFIEFSDASTRRRFRFGFCFSFVRTHHWRVDPIHNGSRQRFKRPKIEHFRMPAGWSVVRRKSPDTLLRVMTRNRENSLNTSGAEGETRTYGRRICKPKRVDVERRENERIFAGTSDATRTNRRVRSFLRRIITNNVA